MNINLPEWISLFSFSFMQRAIAGGVLLGILGGILGGFLILRRLSLFGDTVGHSGMLGVVLAALFQFPTNWTLIIFTVVYGLGILYLIDRTNLNSDTILCIALASSISLGTIGLSFLRGYRGNLLSILLGDILSISNTDLILLLMLLSATIIWLGWTLPDQMLLTLNPDLAKVQGIPVQKYRYGFIIVLSLTIALTVRAVGILLMNGFLVIPAATAKILSRQFVPFLITAAAIGAMSAVIGMIISGAFDLPSGPTIVLVQLFGFLVTGFLSKGQS